MQQKALLIDLAIERFNSHFGHKPEVVVAAPGRANIIGEHTDYNDGHVLPIAIDRYLVAAASSRSDRKCKLHSTNFATSFEYDLDRIPEERPQWTSYIVGVVAELEAIGGKISGKEILIHGDIPIGSGLSSSAALEISVATALEKLDGLRLSDAQFVAACRQADHQYVGIKSGPMDQFASRACRAGHCGLLDCRSLEMRHIELPKGLSYLSIYSGIPRSLAESEYNERQESCQSAVSALTVKHRGIKALRDATIDQVESCRDVLGDRIYRRAKHVVTEQKRVFEMVKAFEENDSAGIGSILLEGHQSLSSDYEVSLPVLDEMIDWLCTRPDVLGARLTGAGFGGSLICLIRDTLEDRETLFHNFRIKFSRRTPQPPDIWELAAVDGAKY